MSYAYGKINLAQFEHMKTTVPTKEGNERIEGVFIPFELNNIFVSDKGNMFIDFSTKIKPENFKGEHTHIIQQKLDKIKYAELKEKGVYPPDFGTMTIAGGEGGGEPKPKVSSEFAGTLDLPDDLPF